MQYAIIKAGGKQHRVEEGQDILIDRVSGEKDAKYEFPDVLMIRSDKAILVGTPQVNGAKVVGKIVDHVQGEKIRILKYKAKVNYRRRMGFRAQLTKVHIEKINVSATV